MPTHCFVTRYNYQEQAIMILALQKYTQMGGWSGCQRKNWGLICEFDWYKKLNLKWSFEVPVSFCGKLSGRLESLVRHDDKFSSFLLGRDSISRCLGSRPRPWLWTWPPGARASTSTSWWPAESYAETTWKNLVVQRDGGWWVMKLKCFYHTNVFPKNVYVPGDR